MNAIVISGSSRVDGNTNKLLDSIPGLSKLPRIKLSDHRVGYFDYDNRNASDDFLSLIDQMLSYDTIVFATPVYWYSMSAQLKTFFDRLSDLLKWEKERGRQLRGKRMFVISCSNDNDLPNYFYKPFEDTAKYLGIQYLGDFHGWGIEEGSINPLFQKELITIDLRLKTLNFK